MTKKMNVKWREGARVGCSAEAAYRFFERIREENDGDLNLADAVHKSQPKDAPLHNELEWNNKRAADLHRRDQMRRIVRSLQVVRTDMAATPRCYESVKVDVVNDSADSDAPAQQSQPRHVFRRTEDILADPATRAELLGQAVRDALAFRKRYAALSELAHLIEVIDEEVRKLA